MLLFLEFRFLKSKRLIGCHLNINVSMINFLDRDNIFLTPNKKVSSDLLLLF